MRSGFITHNPMKKHYILSLLSFVCCLFFNTLAAQSWQWGISGGSYQTVQSDEKAESLTTDSNGNVYFISPVGVNGLKVAGVEKEAFFTKDYMIASISCSGTYRWSRVIGGVSDDLIKTIQLDANNNVYAAGHVFRTSASGQVHFGQEQEGTYDTILPYSALTVNTNKQKLFLVKYNSEGEMQWLRMPEADDIASTESQQSYSHDVQTDPQGNSHWLVTIPPGTYANGAFVNTLEGSNLFVFKYDTDGNFISATALDMQFSSIFPYFTMVRDHTNGILYFGGYTTSQVGPVVINGATVGNSMFLAAFNGDGTFLWKHENAEGYLSSIRNMYIDTDSSLYVGGSGFNGDTFMGHTFTSAYGSGFPFITKINASGTLDWATNAQTISSVSAVGGITINGNEVGITAGFGSMQWGDFALEQEPNEGYDVMLARFNKADGAIIALTDIAGNPGYWDYGTSITADPFGNYYVGGKFDNILYVNEETTLVDGAQGTDFFVAKYGTDNCSCLPPTANYSFTTGTVETLAYNFTYTGDAYDTISWNFGDGVTSAEANPIHTFTNAGSYNVCVSVANACGTSEFCQEITATLNVEDFEMDLITAYPNPVTDVLNLTSKSEISYTLYSVLGTEIVSGTVKPGTSQIKLDHLAAGSYLLKVQNSSGHQRAIKVFKK